MEEESDNYDGDRGKGVGLDYSSVQDDVLGTVDESVVETHSWPAWQLPIVGGRLERIAYYYWVPLAYSHHYQDDTLHNFDHHHMLHIPYQHCAVVLHNMPHLALLHGIAVQDSCLYHAVLQRVLVAVAAVLPRVGVWVQ